MTDEIAQLDEDIARGLQKDGLSADEVRTKLIGVHGVPMAQALVIVEAVFGAEAAGPKAIRSARRKQMLTTGLALMALGAIAAVAVYGSDLHQARTMVWMYVGAFGAFSSGLIFVVRALVDD